MGTFKKEFPEIVDTVLTACDIYSADGHKFHTEKALWDTGADTTIISSRIVGNLRLQPYKQGGIAGIGGASDSNVYLVHILVPTGDFIREKRTFNSQLPTFNSQLCPRCVCPSPD